jgi:hypothetical protein
MPLTNNSTWSSVVVRRGLTWFARYPRDTMSHATPDWAATNLPRVVLAAGSLWFPRTEEGTVLWQLPNAVDTHAMVEELTRQGWKVGAGGHETGWFTCRREGYAIVHLGIARMMANDSFPLVHLKDEGKKIALRLADYHALTGLPWRGSAGMNACAQIRNIHGAKPDGQQPLWRWAGSKECPGIGCSFELRGSRDCRPIEDHERDMRYVHQFDIRSMHLAAANVGMFGWSAPEQRGPQEFDPTRPGYWIVRRADLDGVSPLVVRPGPDPLVPLTTPVMSYLVGHQRFPEVMDSWTSERGGRYLKGWAERLDGALRTAPPSLDPKQPSMERALKETYKRAFGMMKRDGGRVHRPDWSDTGRDTARINALRKVDVSGFEPLRWNVDSVWIATELEAAVVGKALGIAYTPAGDEIRQIGKFRHITTITPAEYAERYELAR